MLSKSKKTQSVHVMITEQIKDVETCLIHFESFMQAATTPETVPQTLRTLSVCVGQAEASADSSLRRMIDSLAGGAYLPSTRESLISIATSCDHVANKCEYVSNVMIAQKFRFPASFSKELTDIIAITRAQFEILEKTISKLFSDFGNLLKDHTILDRIREKESEVDNIEKKLYERIYDMDVELAEKMQTTQVLGAICDISDVIENIADQIQIMLITRKA